MGNHVRLSEPVKPGRGKRETKFVPLPESLKVKVVGVDVLSTDVESLVVDLGFGENQVAILLAMRAIYQEESVPTYINYRWAVWKRDEAVWPEPDITPDYLIRQSSVIAAGGKISLSQSTSGRALDSCSEDFYFPYPVVITRPIQFLYKVGQYENARVGALFYYVHQDISPEDLARIMVKDHD
jgi:hypothetical protein